MNVLENKIQQLTNLYTSAIDELKSMAEANFDEKLDNAKNLAISAKSVKEEILSSYDKEMLKKYESSLVDLAKQIQVTYDNIVEEKQKVLLEVANELKNLQNQKKIAVYGR